MNIQKTYRDLVNTEDILRQIPAAVEDPKSTQFIEDMAKNYTQQMTLLRYICSTFQICYADYDLEEDLTSKDRLVSLSMKMLTVIIKIQFEIRFNPKLRVPEFLERLQISLRQWNLTNAKFLDHINYWEKLWKYEFETYALK